MHLSTKQFHWNTKCTQTYPFCQKTWEQYLLHQFMGRYNAIMTEMKITKAGAGCLRECKWRENLSIAFFCLDKHMFPDKTWLKGRIEHSTWLGADSGEWVVSFRITLVGVHLITCNPVHTLKCRNHWLYLSHTTSESWQLWIFHRIG